MLPPAVEVVVAFVAVAVVVLLVGVDVLAVLCIPVFVVDTEVTTCPDALILLAVTASIISTFSTVAPLMKISSVSLFISYKLPKLCAVCFGTRIIVTKLGASSCIINALSSVK